MLSELPLVLASASAFHFSKAHLSNIPGLDNVLKNNPDILAKLINGKKEESQFMTEQEINIQNQRRELQERERLLKQQMNNMRNQNGNMGTQPNANSQQFPLNNNSGNNDESYRNAHHPASLNPGLPNPLLNTPNIKAPQTVNDVLNQLHNTNSADTQEESSVNNDRIVSDTNSEKRRGRKKKSLMQVM